jgi:hypothetical protein
MEKAALGRVFSEYFCFSCQAFHRLPTLIIIHHHLVLVQDANKWLQFHSVLKGGSIYTNKKEVISNLGVCILLRVLDQVQGFPFNTTPFQ